MERNIGNDLIALIEQLIEISSTESLKADNSKGMIDNNGIFVEF